MTKREQILEKLNCIKNNMPAVLGQVIEEGKDPEEATEIYNEILNLLDEVEADVKIVDDDELDRPKMEK